MSVEIDIKIFGADRAVVEYRVRGIVMERSPFDTKNGSMEKCKEHAFSKFVEWHDAVDALAAATSTAQ